MFSSIQKHFFALQNACWGSAQTPLFCIFQCRLRVPAGRFLSDQKSSIISVKSVWKRCHMDLPGSTNLIQRKASRTSRLQPLHAKFLLCHDGFIRWVVDLVAVDRIFYRHGSTLLAGSCTAGGGEGRSPSDPAPQ